MLRKLAVALLIIVIIEILAIILTPTYEQELLEEMQAYKRALAEHVTLLNALRQF